MRSPEELDKPENLDTVMTPKEAKAYLEYITRNHNKNSRFEEIKKETGHGEHCGCYYCNPLV